MSDQHFDYIIAADGTHTFKCTRWDCEFVSYGWGTRELCMRRASEHYNEHLTGDRLTSARNRLHTIFDTIQNLGPGHPSRAELEGKLEEARVEFSEAQAGVQYMTEMSEFMRKWA